ncbi:MAG: hypothetical protein IT524_10550 [Nitrosomonas sp.]|nr:hypothetical protein [Nitrosomonas sp.]MCC7092370.1 hypothetical protein [Nitrosomonas sp.]
MPTTRPSLWGVATVTLTPNSYGWRIFPFDMHSTFWNVQTVELVPVFGLGSSSRLTRSRILVALMA